MRTWKKQGRMISLLLKGAGCFVLTFSFTGAPCLAGEINPPLKPLTPKFDRSLEETPEKKLAREYLKHGAKLHRDGHDLIAESFFKKAIKLDEKNPDSYFNLGALYEGKNDFYLALKYYEQGLEAAPSDTELHEAVESMKAKLASGETGNGQRELAQIEPPPQFQQPVDQTAMNQNPDPAPAPAPVLAQNPPQSSGINGVKTRAILGMIVRMGLKAGIRAAFGSGGGFGF